MMTKQELLINDLPIGENKMFLMAFFKGICEFLYFLTY